MIKELSQDKNIIFDEIREELIKETKTGEITWEYNPALWAFTTKHNGLVFTAAHILGEAEGVIFVVCREMKEQPNEILFYSRKSHNATLIWNSLVTTAIPGSLSRRQEFANPEKETLQSIAENLK